MMVEDGRGLANRRMADLDFCLPLELFYSQCVAGVLSVELEDVPLGLISILGPGRAEGKRQAGQPRTCSASPPLPQETASADEALPRVLTSLMFLGYLLLSSLPFRLRRLICLLPPVQRRGCRT